MTLPMALKQLRAELHLQQKELAELLHMNITTVNRWEAGKTVPMPVVCKLLISVAQEQGASEVCIGNLEETLFPSNAIEEQANDLRRTEIDSINQLVNESANGVIVINTESHEILYVNNKIAEMTGHSIEESKTMTCHEFLMKKKNISCEDCADWICCRGETSSREFTSEVTGKHYLVHSKSIIWQGQQAQIKYITDITEQQRLKEQLEQQQEALNYATQITGLQVFQYDIKNNTALLISHAPKGVKLPKKVKNFADKAIQNGVVLPEYAKEYHQMLQDMKDGKQQSEIEIQTREADGRTHWVHFQMNLTAVDDQGNPSMAIGTARLIDREKSMESRILFEHKRILQENKGMQSYVVADLTENKIIEYGGDITTSHRGVIGTSYEQSFTYAIEYIVGNDEKEQFLKLHQREQLLAEFEKGIVNHMMEYRVVRMDGFISFLRNQMYLYQDPVNKQVFLYEYCFDIDQEKILSGLLHSTLFHHYNQLGILSLGNGQLTKMNYSEDTHKRIIEYVKHENEIERFSADVISEDRAYFRKCIARNNIEEQLKDREMFTFNYHTKNPDGSVILKQGLVSWFDKKSRTCLVTSMDIEGGVKNEPDD